MKAENFAKILNADFYTGVPDSQLKALCNYLMHTYGIDPKHHVIGRRLSSGYRKSPGSIHAEQRRRQYHQPRGIPAER